jgi:endonuclease G
VKTKVVFISLILLSFVSCQRVARTSHAREAVTADHSEKECEWKHLELPHVKCSREQIIEHLAYTVSYNHDWNLPNWVAYELTNDELYGNVERSNHFAPDPLVYGDPVVTYDYTHSGYDRGHMVPAADMKWSEKAMRESFYMTNICPQNQNLNRGDWNDLEELARDWARKYGNLYIACGPLVSQDYRTIGQNKKIAIPNAFFKVFLRQTDTSWTESDSLCPIKQVIVL